MKWGSVVMNERWEVIMPGKKRYASFPRLPWEIIVLIILVIAFLLTSFFTVNAGEVGLVLRFGKFHRKVYPGLHFKIPFGVERVFIYSVERVYKEEFGFRTKSIGERTTYTPAPNPEEPIMLTGDLSIVHVEWVVQYRIQDPFHFRFHMKDPIKTLRDISQAVMRRVVGDRTVDEVLTYGREEIAQEVKEQMQEILDFYESGIEIETIRLQNVQPPDPVKPAFHQVNEAKQLQERLINEAWERYNREIPKAKGEAKQTIQEAEGYATEVVNRSKGEAERFLSILEEYRKAPEVTRQRMLIETLSKVLPDLQQVVILDEDTKNLVPLLSIPGLSQQFQKLVGSQEK